MKAGRHRTFDKSIALDRAMEVFWTNGYPGTTLSDLTNAMGINKPSLYSAFGNKEELYKDALGRYVQKYGITHAQHLMDPDKSLSQRIRCYLTSIAEMVTASSLPGGCFVCFSTCEVSGNCLPDKAIQAISEINKMTSSSLVEFFKIEKQKGNLTNDQSPERMANYIMALQFGLSVMARNKSRIEELFDVINISTSIFK